ncbi:hypothetical protein Q3G72_027537 [Acer saccharum]|nr:hypothetical protein Q3G72_027537 [Acer saccharum]
MSCSRAEHKDHPRSQSTGLKENGQPKQVTSLSFWRSP